MSGKIRFSVFGTNLHIDIQSSSALLMNTNPPIDIIMTGKTPLEVLKELENILSYYFVFDNRKPLDTVVENMLSNLGVRKIDWKSIPTIKSYAKFFYQVWINKDKTDLTNTDTDYNRQTASIVIDILSWWYIRRLVHIYVICAILEAVHGSTQVSNSPMTLPSFPAMPTPSFTTNTEVDILKAKYNKDVSDLEFNKSQLQADVQKLVSEYETLQKDYQILYSISVNKDNIIAGLEKKLEDFKELLLHSTTMMFKIEEIPNINNSLKS